MLQTLDEGTKTKVLIVSAAVIMAVVFYLWLMYFNGIIASVPQMTAVQDPGAGSATGIAGAADAGTASGAVPNAAPAAAEPAPAPSSVPIPALSTTAAAPEGPGFWARFKAGTAGLGERVVGFARWFAGIFQSPRQYIVKPTP